MSSWLPRLVTLAVLATSLVAPAFAQRLQPIPKLTARVTDLTGTLTAEQQSLLEEKLAAFEARKGAQVAVLVVPSTKPEDISLYSIRAVTQWMLGRKNIDDGALLIVAKNDRELRIEVGKGLEGALTDLTAHRIISETITPLFRQGDFYGGINAGLDQVIRVIDGEPLPVPDAGWQGHSARGVSHLFPYLFIAVMYGAVALRDLFGRATGALIAGVATGVGVYFVEQALGMAVAAGMIVLLFSLTLGFFGGRRGGWSPGYGTTFSRYGELSGLGRGERGGGGGGFHGGGGGFNGGGASGRW